MAAIVTEENVRQIYPDAPEDLCFLPYIAMAASILDEHYSGTARFFLEQALAAHFAALTLLPVVEFRAFEYGQKYDTSIQGKGIESTRFGVLARTFMTPALLAAIYPREVRAAKVIPLV